MNRLRDPMRRGPPDRSNTDAHPVGVFWDQSLVWGLICVETMENLGVPYRLLSAGEIAGGALERHRVLLVPGGWASHKISALGEDGAERIRRFIQDGGSYLGFCGGAGLALSSPPSLHLVPLKRLPLSRRLPSASGEVWIAGSPGHEAWRDLPPQIPVSVWWPSQFALERCESIECVASYSAVGKDFWVADIPFADMKDPSLNIQEWERIYGINLDPSRILGHPAILEARHGKGVLILSYPHLETPGDFWGNRLFRNMIGYLDRTFTGEINGHAAAGADPGGLSTPPTRRALRVLHRFRDRIDGLIRFGERHLLWNWRNPWLLRWRRGIRGLEYGTLAVTAAFLVRHLEEMSVEGDVPDPWVEPLEEAEGHVEEFCRKARLLLLEEKLSAQSGSLKKMGSVNERVDALRTFLFGDQMNHAGLSRTLFDRLDPLLLRTLRLRQAHGLRHSRASPP